jgi:D-alanyl-D-alanine carboxypeptidase
MSGNQPGRARLQTRSSRRGTSEHDQHPTSPLTAALALLLLVLALVLWPETRAALAEEQPVPARDARAAVVVDAETGAVLYERSSHAELAPASLTKMATALVAVERAALDRSVRITHPYAVTPILIGLEPGDTLSLEAVLYGLMLNSGNDAALAIAETVGDGSTERFVGWMNDLVRRLGLNQTRFKNPHGLDQEGHVSSAYDMAIIGRAYMRHPALARIAGQRRHELDGPPRWVFLNRNPLLGTYAGLDGIKTGFDDLAGPCLVATAVRDDRRAVAVVMNSPRYADDAASLLDYAFADRSWGRLVPAEAGVTAAPRLAMLRADLSAPGGAPRTVARASSLLRAGDHETERP